MKHWEISPSGPLRGRIRVPGDKSISHRSLLFNALAQGDAEVEGLLRAKDVLSTWSCLEALGVRIEDVGSKVRIWGSGGRFKEPESVLDCGNSGTSFRLLCGALAGQPFFSVLTGDRHLKKRPMRRVTVPLGAMGARFWGAQDAEYPPIGIQGGNLLARHYASTIASAQVKSAMMLAAIQADGTLHFREPHRSRDHSERMMRAMGVSIEEREGELIVPGGQTLQASSVVVPGDISSAAFFLVAALIVPGSDLVVEGVGVNPTRSGILDVLRRMNGSIETLEETVVSGERIATLRVKHSALQATRVDGGLIPRLVDELPVIAVAAACAEGETVFADAEELRVKESDRIAATAAGLIANGVEVEELPDGLRIQGGTLKGGRVDSMGDHRIAMAFAVAALAGATSTIEDVENVSTSFPQFRDLLNSVIA